MHKHNRSKLGAGLALGALGVVFGDIGTSPLYALKVVFGLGGERLPVSQGNVLGVISLIIWSVTLVVSYKYVGLVMRAGNRGEGGVMALVALLRHGQLPARRLAALVTLGILGIALFYGDSIVTPAISVLSAVEGLGGISAGLKPLVLPITLLLIAGLFWIQKYGTGLIGRLFGPVMLAWFIMIGLAGTLAVARYPLVLGALSPLAGVSFVSAQPLTGLLSFGAVVLAVTGAEALYADMGHFGRKPISHAWFFVVFPALALCYLGQGAAVLTDPRAFSTPFMALFPAVLHIPVVILATAATLIASQSVLSGAFSLTRQAIQLDFLPRMRVLHTSVSESGQVYLPLPNLLLFGAVVLLVAGFGSSAALAGIYGIAVSGALLIDSLLFLAVARLLWRTSRGLLVLAGLPVLALDTTFVVANLPKIPGGGWLPLLVAAAMLAVLSTWYHGQRIVAGERRAMEGPLQPFVMKLRRRRPPLVRVPGCAVYIGHHAGQAPLALHAAVEKLQELHRKVVIVSVVITNAAHIPDQERAVFSDLGGPADGISRLDLSYGYHDSPNLPRTLAGLRSVSPELNFDLEKTTYFISQSRIVATRRRNLAGWRKALYITLSHNALSTSDYYKLPAERTIEMRSLIEL